MVLGLAIGLSNLLPCLVPPYCVSVSDAPLRRCISHLTPYEDSKYCCRGAAMVILPMFWERIERSDDVEVGGWKLE